MDYDEKQLIEKLINAVDQVAHQVARIATKYAGPEERRWPGCVVEGQMVATPDGPVPVEQLREDATVLTYDFSTEQTVPTKVRSRRATTADAYLLIDGQLAVTGVHELYSEARGWIAASELRLGEPLRTLAGPRATKALELVAQRASVYAVEVDLHSCFFANGYLVHNKA